jgi:quercetin dioxygenase-like cupin family protein
VCEDLDASLRHYTQDLGFVVDEVFPADSPRLVVVSRGDERVRLERAPSPTCAAADEGRPGSIVTPAAAGDWVTGRAGMAYRDLIPGRCGGRVIASHIRIPEGGPVPDYVHFHRVAFQMIFCVRGWVRVVYDDQGPPFVMEPGDCVLQPPEIRHRVLECSDGLEVVEVSAPAEHRTIADRATALPTGRTEPGRLFGGQRFVFHRARSARWRPGPDPGFETRDTGIGEATAALGTAVVLRATTPGADLRLSAGDGLSFQFVLSGHAGLNVGRHGAWRLGPADAFVLPDDADTVVTSAADGVELLRVVLRLP